jgi:hypothetical protein
MDGLYADDANFRRGQIGTPLFIMPGGGSVFGACTDFGHTS